MLYVLKEVDWLWFFFAGTLLVVTLSLYLPQLPSRIKKILAATAMAASLLGVATLLWTDLGQKLPLLNTFVQTNPIEPQAVDGLEIYIKYGCPNCHLLNGWGPARSIGPDLAVAVANQGTTWVSYYLQDVTFRGETNPIMPHYTFLKESELDKLIIFLESASRSNEPSTPDISRRSE